MQVVDWAVIGGYFALLFGLAWWVIRKGHGRRFNPTSRWVLSLISLVAYVLTKLAVGIFSGGVVFSVLLPELNFLGLDSFWVGAILVVVLTGVYTVLGGLRTEAYTEVF